MISILTHYLKNAVLTKDLMMKLEIARSLTMLKLYIGVSNYILYSWIYKHYRRFTIINGAENENVWFNNI